MKQNQQQSNHSEMKNSQSAILNQCRYQHDQEIGLAISRFFKNITGMFKHDHSFRHAVTR